MRQRALIIGAGRIARGLIADMLTRSNCDIVFAVRSQTQRRLEDAGKYDIRFYGKRDDTLTIDRYTTVSLADATALERELVTADFVFTAVGAGALAEIANTLAPPLQQALERREKTLNIFLFENSDDGADLFRTMANATRTGVVPCVVDRLVTTVTEPGSLDLTACARDTTVYEAGAVIGSAPELHGFLPCDDIAIRRQSKMMLTNMPQATAAALGYLKGYEFVNNCCRDPDISAVVRGAMTEVRDGMAAAGTFISPDIPDPAAYAEEFFGYFSAEVCSDQVTRVLTDPIRKLQVGERFLAPALLCLQHALPVENLARGIAAAMLFDHGNDAGAMRVQQLVAEHGLSNALAEIAGLDRQAPILRCVERQVEQVKTLRMGLRGGNSE